MLRQNTSVTITDIIMRPGKTKQKRVFVDRDARQS